MMTTFDKTRRVLQQQGSSWNQLTALERDNTVRAARKIQVMSDVNRSEAPGAMQLVQKAHNHLARAKIEVARGFVGQQYFRIAHQGACQNHPLLLSAR